MTKKLFWIVAGDSITSTATPVKCWPFHYLGLTPTYDNTTCFGVDGIFWQSCRVYRTGNVILKNMAITGSTLADQIDISFYAFKDTLVDPTYAVKTITPAGAPAPSGRVFLVTDSLGSNEKGKLSGSGGGGMPVSATTADYVAIVASMAAERKARGCDLVGLSTLLPRDTAWMTEVDRLAYNSAITAPGWAAAHNVDFIMDFAGDAIMGNPANLPMNNGGDTTWYQADSTHPTDAGQARLATVAATYLDPIIAAL
jgi:hypothetical protein